ncbi:MAG: phage tail family protein [Anaerolinea sp.]|nr:phage tail family protein [Anaerolinea sp.]
MFYFQRFGTLFLPDGSPKGDMASFETHETGEMVAGGFIYDTHGRDPLPSAPTAFTHHAGLLSNTPAELEDAYRSLLALYGQWNRLYRIWLPSQSVQWIYARLRKVRAQTDLEYPSVIRSVTCVFSARSPHWNGRRHGGSWKFDTGEKFDTGLEFDMQTDDVITLSAGTTVGNITNGGNVAVTAVRVVIKAVGTDIDEISIAIAETNCHIEYTDTISAGSSVAIDGGAMSVKEGTTNKYVNFELGANHANQYWMQLAPGNNTITIVRTGGSAAATVTFEFYEGWA